MSTYAPQQPYVEYPKPTNGLGMAGFVLSIVGLLTLGILCPITLIISLIALGKAPRGFAVGGVIISLFGTLLAVVLAVVFFVVAAGAVLLFALIGEPEKTEISADMIMTAVAVEMYRDENRYLPASLADLGITGSVNIDPWGNPYRYVLVDEDPGYDLISDGEDGIPGNDDDAKLSRFDEMWDGADTGLTFNVNRGDDNGHLSLTFGDRVFEIRGDDEGGFILDTGTKTIDLPANDGESVDGDGASSEGDRSGEGSGG